MNGNEIEVIIQNRYGEEQESRHSAES